MGTRDFAIEFVSCCTLIQLHLSRLSEELVLWSSQEFSFVDIADRFCTQRRASHCAPKAQATECFHNVAVYCCTKGLREL